MYPWRNIKTLLYVNLFHFFLVNSKRKPELCHLLSFFTLILIGGHSLFENIYPNSSYDSIVDGFFQPARAGLVAVSGFPTEEVYINYAHGNEGPDVWFGAQNLPRLSALKREWDPNNYFGKGNPVPA